MLDLARKIRPLAVQIQSVKREPLAKQVSPMSSVYLADVDAIALSAVEIDGVCFCLTRYRLDQCQFFACIRASQAKASHLTLQTG